MSRKACKFADIKPNTNGTKVLRKDKSFRCLYPAPEMPLMQASITGAYGFKWPPNCGSAFADSCATCPCWEADK